jgi:uncharacterized membrane protein YbaN (DUF454 family)
VNATDDLRKPRVADQPVEAGDRGRSATFSEEDGILVVRDPSLFRSGREGFCRRLAVAAGRVGVRSAQVSLASATCRLEFEAGRTDASEMARCFVAALRATIDGIATTGPPSRRDHGWTSLAVFHDGEHTSTWEVVRERPGALRLRHPSLLQDRDLARRIAAELSEVPGIESSRATLLGGDLDVRFDPGRSSPISALSAAEATSRRALRTAPRSLAREDQAPAVETGARRLGYLALAGGSFGLTIVGLVVPGIPTIPFLLATSYYLARSSPRLNRVLLRSRFFGPILADLETAGGLRWINKIKLISFTLVVAVVTVVVAGPTLVVSLLILTAIAVSLFAIVRIPEIRDGSEPAHRAELMSARA